MSKKVLPLKNYEIHAITTVWQDQVNANIASWVMQSAMKGKRLLVSLYHPDLTIGMVRQSGVLNVHLLGQHQKNLVRKFGKQSGRDKYKLKNVHWTPDERGCPVLPESVGVIYCEVEKELEGYDHNYFECSILRQHVFHPDAPVMSTHWLKSIGYIR